MHASEPTRGGKRRTEADLNLVPYVDILMTLMAFLVVTAIFTQMSALQVAAGDGPAAMNEAPSKPPACTAPAAVITLTSTTTRVQPRANADVLAADDAPSLRNALRVVQAQAGSDDDACPVQLRAEDGVVTARIVAVVDALAGAGFAVPRIDPA